MPTQLEPDDCHRDLGVLGRCASFTLWRFPAAKINDPITPGFFDACSDHMSAGDHILVSAPDGAAMLWVRSSSAMGVKVQRMIVAEHAPELEIAI